MFSLQKIRMLGGEVTDDMHKCTHLVSIDGKRWDYEIVFFFLYRLDMIQMAVKKSISLWQMETVVLLIVISFRTIPLLQALAMGKNIVSPQWVNTSYEQKQFAGMLKKIFKIKYLHFWFSLDKLKWCFSSLFYYSEYCNNNILQIHLTSSFAMTKQRRRSDAISNWVWWERGREKYSRWEQLQSCQWWFYWTVNKLNGPKITNLGLWILHHSIR